MFLNGSITDRKDFNQPGMLKSYIDNHGSHTDPTFRPQSPRGLELPFDLMMELAAIEFPFEYEKGLAFFFFSVFPFSVIIGIVLQ